MEAIGEPTSPRSAIPPGGGCVNALKLAEEVWALLADACKGHLSDLYIEDLAKPFKAHLKTVHELIIFIVAHDFVYGLFISYEGVRALSIPADTRFATEIICARSLLTDKEQVQKLFVDSQFDVWMGKQDAAARTKVSGSSRVKSSQVNSSRVKLSRVESS